MPILFLLRLQGAELPVRVTDPKEVQHVSMLVATGLVEAEIAPIKSQAQQAGGRVATVTRITEAGLAEIARAGDVPPRSG